MAFLCTLMDDPVVASDGHTYNREDIQNWFKHHDTSPHTNEPFEHKNLIPNIAMRKQIIAWREKHGLPVLSFADSASWAGQSPVGTGTATISWAPAPSPAPAPASAITQTTAPMGYPGGTGGAATGVRALGQEGFLALTTLQAQGRTKGRGERVREVVEESQDPDDALPPSQHVRTGDE